MAALGQGWKGRGGAGVVRFGPETNSEETLDGPAAPSKERGRAGGANRIVPKIQSSGMLEEAAW